MATKKQRPTIMPLTDRAVLIKFSQSVWNASKADKTASDKVAVDFGLKNKKVGRYLKKLLPDDFLRRERQVRMRAYLYHNEHTSPWLDGGVRIKMTARVDGTQVAALDEYLAQMRKFKSEHDEIIADMKKRYADAMHDGMLLQAKLANEKDYPSADEFAKKFAIGITILPMPSIDDWRVALPRKQIEELKKQAERDVAEMQKTAMLDLYSRILDAVSRVHGRLSDGDAVFRDSLFQSLKKVLVVVESLNLTNDPKIEEIRKEIESKITKQVPDVVRADPTLRKKVANDASAIMRKMAVYMGTA